jgi:hypothetical protein
LVDDVRRFVDDRPCVTYRTSSDALVGLREMANAGTVVDELWLDHDLGGADTIRPILTLLDELDHYGPRLIVGRTYIITSNPSGANGMRLALTRLGYNFERLYTLRGLLTAQPQQGASDHAGRI